MSTSITSSAPAAKPWIAAHRTSLEAPSSAAQPTTVAQRRDERDADHARRIWRCRASPRARSSLAEPKDSGRFETQIAATSPIGTPEPAAIADSQRELLGDPVEEPAEDERRALALLRRGAAAMRAAPSRPRGQRPVTEVEGQRTGGEGDRQNTRPAVLQPVAEQLEADRADQRAGAEAEQLPIGFDGQSRAQPSSAPMTSEDARRSPRSECGAHAARNATRCRSAPATGSLDPGPPRLPGARGCRGIPDIP